MRNTEHPPWTMPPWMEKYRAHFTNTGGNSLEDLLNDHDSNQFNNVIRAGLIVSVGSQVGLLHRLKAAGLLALDEPDEETPTATPAVAAGEWQPSVAADVPTAEKVAAYDDLHDRALEIFNAAKGGTLREDDDREAWLFEAVMELLGEDVWEAYNKYLKERYDVDP